MADPFALAEFGLRLALLPPISRGTHLDGPRLQAKHLANLWCADGAVFLAEAFRLLDVPMIAGVLLRTAVEIETADPRYWPFPDFEALLPPLRDQAWQEILVGRLVLEAVPAKGSRPMETSNKRRSCKPPYCITATLFAWLPVCTAPAETGAPGQRPRSDGRRQLPPDLNLEEVTGIERQGRRRTQS